MVEGVEVELIAGSASPETEIVGVVSVVSWHWGVIGLGHHDLTILPDGSLSATLVVLSDTTIEPHWVHNVGSLDLPWVALLEPEIWDLDLAAIDDLLLEDTVVVSDSVAPSWQLKGGHRVEEAGSESTETSISEGGIGLLLVDLLEVVADVHESFLVLLLHVDVDEHVLHHAAHQELKREVVASLHIFCLNLSKRQS